MFVICERCKIFIFTLDQNFSKEGMFLPLKSIWASITQNHNMFEKDCNLDRLDEKSDIIQKRFYNFLLILNVACFVLGQCSFPKLRLYVIKNVK